MENCLKRINNLQNILIFSMDDISNDPRPYRMLECLKNEYNITVLTKKLKNINDNIRGIDYIIHNMGKENKITKIKNIIKNQFKLFESSLWTVEMIRVRDELLTKDFNYIVCHNITLLPLAFSIKKSAKILFDAREYYPRHFEDRFLWRIMFQGFNKYLCYKYMPKVNHIITVSNGIMDQYKKDLNIHNIDVIESLPDYHELEINPIDHKKIKIIHHGNATLSRRIEDMIYMMDYTDSRFELNLMLMRTDIEYYKKLEELCEKRDNINLIEPVKYKDIVLSINKYDIGIFNAYPSTFNLKHTLPNKFFEFIQARLAVVIGPSIEMMSFIDEYNIGTYSKDFTAISMAKTLNKLTKKDILRYKENSNKAAKKLNKDINCIKIKQILKEL